ncbi:MAG: type II toxin-antitoxin system RelE/ParE family toxin [Desulfobacterales bacterium]
MNDYRLTNQAVEDLKQIGRYTQDNWGREQKNKYLEKPDEGFKTIAREPQMGVACDDIRAGYRKFHVGRHFIFYLITDVYIKIIRILHERMNVDSHLQ